MTLLAAVKTADYALVAADSLQTWSLGGYGEPVEKIQEVPGQALIYAIFGEGGYDAQFQKFLADFRFDRWDRLVSTTATVVQANEAKSAPGGFGAIVAGVLGGEVGVYPLGRHTLSGEDGSSWFIGTNRLAAKVAWDVARTIKPDHDVEELFRLVLDTVVNDAGPAFLAPPVHIWRVTADAGCEHVWPQAGDSD